VGTALAAIIIPDAARIAAEEWIRKGRERDRCWARKRETPNRREARSPEKNPAFIGDIPCRFGSLFFQVGEDSVDILPVPC
jgi:hypothetical protein